MTLAMCNFQDWVEEEYPPYADGPGYIISSDIARFIASEFEQQKLKVCMQIFFQVSFRFRYSFFIFKGPIPKSLLF
jgi:hypothetical protein